MSNLAELTRQVGVLNRSIKEYIVQLESFKWSNSEQFQLIQIELSGDSSNAHSMRMLSCVSAADSTLKSSLEALERASSALLRVEMR